MTLILHCFESLRETRGDSESFNAWYKRRLPTKEGRAATLSIDSQLFDYLAGACVRNAITWSTWLND